MKYFKDLDTGRILKEEDAYKLAYDRMDDDLLEEILSNNDMSYADVIVQTAMINRFDGNKALKSYKRALANELMGDYPGDYLRLEFYESTERPTARKQKSHSAKPRRRC